MRIEKSSSGANRWGVVTGEGDDPGSRRVLGFRTKRAAVGWIFLASDGPRFYAGGPEILAAAEHVARDRAFRGDVAQGMTGLGLDLRNAGAGCPVWWSELAERLGLTAEQAARVGATKKVLDGTLPRE